MVSIDCDHQQLVVDRLWLVAERVGELRKKGISDESGDLLAAGRRCLAKLLAKHPDADDAFLRDRLDDLLPQLAVYHSLVRDKVWLVAERVGCFLDIKGLRFDPRTGLQARGRAKRKQDQVDNLFSAGLVSLSQALAKHPDANNQFLRDCIKRDIQHHWQTDKLIAVPPSTRYDRVKRGDDPGDFTLHDLDPEWTNSLSGADEWHEVAEHYDLLFSLCRDDADRAILIARCDGGLTPQILHDGFLPVHDADVAREVGLSRREVQRRLDDLERRYYRLLDRRIPTRRARQRAPR